MIDSAYEHKCSEIPEPGVRVVRSSAEEILSRWTWCLVVEREATEADLSENAYLEEVGDSMWSTYVGISHCPYCGDKLGSDSAHERGSSEFVHLGGRGWGMERT